MSSLVAKSVSSLEELYSKKCIDWNFEFKAAAAGAGKDYVVILHVIEDRQPEPNNNKGYPTVFGPQLPEAERPDLHTTKTEYTTHWYSLLPLYASKVQTLRIDGVGLDGKSLVFGEYDMTKNAADAGKLSQLLDGSSSIYTYDAERAFALLRRIFDDDALASGHFQSREKQTKIDVGKLEYIRQAPWFFSEGEMIHWRTRCRDIRSTFPNKKYNRDIGVEQLVANHVSNDGDMDSRGGVFVAYQAICMTFLQHVEWDHVFVEHND